MDIDSVRSFTDEQVLKEFGKAMLAHSNGYYDFTARMEVLRAEALRRMGEGCRAERKAPNEISESAFDLGQADRI
jgi:hypothetical protein